MVNVETRKTAQGTEYWDAIEKRIRFVPVGKEPDFEITIKPESMIVGVDLANGKDKTSVGGKVIDTQTDIDLDVMDVEQLRSFAEQNEIEIPFNMKKEETIRNHIVKALNAADGE